MRVAIIHYWLVGMRGGEKVLEELCALYPDADIYTHVYVRAKTSDVINQHRIHTTFIARLPFAARLYQIYLPLMFFALENLDLTGYDLIISHEAGPAKGVVVHPNATHVCYCSSPMRYVWDLFHVYQKNCGLLKRTGMSILFPLLRVWDFAAAARVDRFVANSSFVARRIKKSYGRESTVVFPPVDLEAYSIAESPRKDYFFCVGQLVHYKRFDLAIAACNRLGHKLVIGGSGPEDRRLRAIAGPGVDFRGWLSSAELGDLYRNCRAVLFFGEEDFGIVPLEAMASGRPVIAYASGGAVDTVIDGKTGILFHHQTIEDITHAMIRFEQAEANFQPQKLRDHAAGFGRAVFRHKMKGVIENTLAEARLAGVQDVKRMRAI